VSLVPQDEQDDREKEVTGRRRGRGMVEHCVLSRGLVRMYSFLASETVGDTSLGMRGP
jgi:protein subunit release factor A